MSTILEALKRSQAMRDAAGGHSTTFSGTSNGVSANRSSGVRLISITLIVAVILATLAWLVLSNNDELAHSESPNNPALVAERATSTTNPTTPSTEPRDSDRSADTRDPQVSHQESGLTAQRDAGERLRELTEQASSRRSTERVESQQGRPATQWDTGPAEPRYQRRESRSEPRPAETEPAPGHRLPENTIEWREFVRGYPRRPPELRLTVHRFHSDPSKRMAMINMRRYAPGDRIESDVVLREIVPQGVVVRIGEQNVLLEAGR